MGLVKVKSSNVGDDETNLVGSLFGSRKARYHGDRQREQGLEAPDSNGVDLGVGGS